jgi:hypothetical protein
MVFALFLAAGLIALHFATRFFARRWAEVKVS